MEVLDDYFKLYNRGRSRQETLLRVLTKGFGGEQKLEDLLVIAKDDARTSELARTLQTALTKEWLTRNIRPEIVLKKLGLNRGATDALLDQNRYTLTAYISLFNEKNPASKKSLLETLLGHYGDVAVAEALTIAESKRATKNLATQMQIQQFQQWQKSGKSAGAIFKQLDIDVDEFLLVMSSKLEALEDYNTTLKVGNLRYKQDTFTVVRKGFGDDVELALVVVRALKTLELENANIPVSTATVKLFGDGENIASSLEKAVVQRYTQYYRNKMAPPPVNAVIDPRRS
ncbi:hypothetical protein F442_22646 [Phytophthora nicotianae P10297]|uniref:RXLR phytopathogen effector protein WY-domain domain-containing protein n=1 Tax=Phytophthora nicotianae P10297 TaxID=1317064 RepID=W2Y1L2_PHYNI|nr:hypothetical protein F442_22646 [Phytophthora nicotianae P10297]